MNTPIDRVMDAMYCQRWSMVGIDEPSTVASHSFNVAMLAMAIRKRMLNTVSYSEQEVCYFALIHDIKEVYTGDIPTPTKMKMLEAGFDPETFDPDVPDEKAPSDIVRTIVKMADLIDNYCFISQHGTGTRAAVACREVEGRLRAALLAAHSDLRQAAESVLAYVLERKSEHPEERNRIEEAGETLRMFTHFSRTPNTPYVGRKPRDSVGST